MRVRRGWCCREGAGLEFRIPKTPNVNGFEGLDCDFCIENLYRGSAHCQVLYYLQAVMPLPSLSFTQSEEGGDEMCSYSIDLLLTTGYSFRRSRDGRSPGTWVLESPCLSHPPFLLFLDHLSSGRLPCTSHGSREVTWFCCLTQLIGGEHSHPSCLFLTHWGNI